MELAFVKYSDPEQKEMFRYVQRCTHCSVPIEGRVCSIGNVGPRRPILASPNQRTISPHDITFIFPLAHFSILSNVKQIYSSLANANCVNFLSKLYIWCLFLKLLSWCAISARTRTKDKYRVVYSDHQRLELEKEFHYSRYITIRRKAELANGIGLSERQVLMK